MISSIFRKEEKSWRKWIFSTSEGLLKDYSVVEVPSFLAYFGHRRMEWIQENLKIDPSSFAKDLLYELDDPLVNELQLKGLSLPEGEFRALSPAQWMQIKQPLQKEKTFPQLEDEWRKRGRELKGILLNEEEESQWCLFDTYFTCAVDSPWLLLEIADHFLFPYQTSFKLIAHTRPRV